MAPGTKRTARKSDTKIVAYKHGQRVFIYEVVDPDTGSAIYVGRTVDLVRRGAEHERKSSKCTQLRERLKLASWKLADNVRVVPELPNGVPSERAAEFEAFFIIQRQTLYDPSDPARMLCCNLKHGDHVTDLNYESVKAEVEAGFTWPEVPLDVVQARAKEAVLEVLVDDFGGEGDDDDDAQGLCMALAVAKMTRKQIERLHMSPLAIAEQLADEYEGKSTYAEIDRAIFETDLNSLRDKLNNEDVVDEKMQALVRAIALFGKSEGAEWQMRAHVATNAFRMLAGAFETREEARLPDTDAVRKMKLVRDWVADNEGKKPAQSALRRKDGSGTLVEQSLGQFLNDWKSFRGRAAYKKADKPACDFLMRHVSWWSAHANGCRAQVTAELTASVNTMLKNGYGNTLEPEFAGKKSWCGGSPGSETFRVYQKMIGMVNGHYDTVGVDAMLAGVDPARAAWYRSQASKNRTTHLASHKRSHATRMARGHAKGVQAHKRQRTSADASSSSLTEAVTAHDDDKGGEDEDSDSDEDSDEDI